jgi:hypothetical protein
MNNRAYMDEELSKKVYETFKEVYGTGKPVKAFDWKIIRKDGIERWIEASVALRKDAAGQPVGFQGVSRDVTERKLAERELAGHRQHLEQMVDERTHALTESNRKLSEQIAERKQAEYGDSPNLPSITLRWPHFGWIRMRGLFTSTKRPALPWVMRVRNCCP